MVGVSAPRQVTRGDSLQDAAHRAWIQALADFYHPPLPEPRIEYEEAASSFFYIDSDHWIVHLNTAGVPLHFDTNEAEPFLRSICQHEIQHYLVCPFDGITNGFMLRAAREYVNVPTAMFVCNLFADLVVDSGLLKRYPVLTHDRVKASLHDSSMRATEHSKLWTLVVATYRSMWGFPVSPMVNIDSSTYEAAQAIVDVARKCIDNETLWITAARKIAKVVAEWTPQEENVLAGCAVSGSESREVPCQGTTVFVPIDIDAVMGNPVEIRNGDRAKRCSGFQAAFDEETEMERLAVQVDQKGGDLRDLRDVYLVAGFGSDPDVWIRFWYRAKAKGLLRTDVKQRTTAGMTPLAAQVWRLGDPIEELDIVQSLQAFPVIVPNMSTRRWITAITHGEETSHSMPDLLIVIDSSGSMAYSMRAKKIGGPYHVALVSAFAALDLALRNNKRVSAINFSDGIRTCDWSTERSMAESVLLQYQGGGTVAPVQTIMKLCSASESQVMVLLISDAEIHNWEDLVESVRHLTRAGHRFFIFRIGRGRKQDATDGDLSEAGATVIPVESIESLPGLVIREARQIYNRNDSDRRF